MRRNKHNIQTYYRTRLFGYRMIMRKKKIVLITKLFVIDLFNNEKEKRTRCTKKRNKEKR